MRRWIKVDRGSLMMAGPGLVIRLCCDCLRRGLDGALWWARHLMRPLIWRSGAGADTPCPPGRRPLPKPDETPAEVIRNPNRPLSYRSPGADAALLGVGYLALPANADRFASWST